MQDIFKDLFGEDGVHFTGTQNGGSRYTGSGAGFGDGPQFRTGGYREPERLDLQKDLHIPFTTAVFGGEVRVATPDGSVMLKIPPGCQCGRKFRLTGKGKKSASDPKIRGDLYVIIQITVPRDLSAAQVRKLREYEHLRKEKNKEKDNSDNKKSGGPSAA
jgi:molecular chaperone DnaJ